MKSFKKLRKQLTEQFFDVVDELEMGWTDFEMCFDEDGGESPAHIRCQWQYRTAQITFNLPECTQLTKVDLDRLIVHELCHILMGPIHQYTKNHTPRDELATENIQRAILAARGTR